MEIERSDAVCSDYVIENEKGINPPMGLRGYKEDTVISGYEAVKSVIKATISPNSFAKIYKSFIFKNIRFNANLHIGEDVELTYKTFLFTKKVSIIHCPHYIFNRFKTVSSNMRSEWDNKKTVSCFICDLSRMQIQINSFTESQNNELKELLLNDCADNFLQLYPRFQKRGSLPEHRKIYLEYVHYIKKNKIVKKFIPYNRKTKLKKLMYLYFRPFYRLFYKLFILK